MKRGAIEDLIQPLTLVLAVRVWGEADGRDQEEAGGQRGRRHPREAEMRRNRGWPDSHLCRKPPPFPG